MDFCDLIETAMREIRIALEFDRNPLLGGAAVSGDIELGLNDLLEGTASSGAAEVEAVPEPGALPLAAFGLAGCVLFRRSLRTRRVPDRY